MPELRWTQQTRRVKRRYTMLRQRETHRSAYSSFFLLVADGADWAIVDKSRCRCQSFDNLPWTKLMKEINAKDRASQFPLHRAATTGSNAFLQLLLNPPEGRPKTRLNGADRAGTYQLTIMCSALIPREYTPAPGSGIWTWGCSGHSDGSRCR